jgi:hypothetical protein
MNRRTEVFDDLAVLAEAMFGGCRGGHAAQCDCPSDDDLRGALEGELASEATIQVEHGWVTLDLPPTPPSDFQELEQQTFRTPGVRGLVTHPTRASRNRPRRRS